MMAVISNPSIRKSVTVNVPDGYGMSYRSVLGFGVCPHILDPKLIKIQHTLSCSGKSFISGKVEVFALSSGGWRSPYGNMPRESIGFRKSQVVINGVIYWLAYDSITDTDNDNDDDDELRIDKLIISFDLTVEEFKELHLPESLSLVDGRLSISKLKESLVVLEYYQETGKEVCGVWMMGHGIPNLFTKLYTINIPDTSLKTVLGFTKSGASIVEIEDDSQLNSHNSKLTTVVNEPDLNHFSDIGICGKGETFSVHSYMETLLLLHQPDLIIHDE